MIQTGDCGGEVSRPGRYYPPVISLRCLRQRAVPSGFGLMVAGRPTLATRARHSAAASLRMREEHATN